MTVTVALSWDHTATVTKVLPFFWYWHVTFNNGFASSSGFGFSLSREGATAKALERVSYDNSLAGD